MPYAELLLGGERMVDRAVELASDPSVDVLKCHGGRVRHDVKLKTSWKQINETAGDQRQAQTCTMQGIAEPATAQERSKTANSD